MKTTATLMDPDAQLWQRVIELEGPSPSAARALLKLRFSERDKALMNELSSKARAGTLSPQEQRELDTFERLGSLLDILHSKARLALKKRPKKAS